LDQEDTGVRRRGIFCLKVCFEGLKGVGTYRPLNTSKEYVSRLDLQLCVSGTISLSACQEDRLGVVPVHAIGGGVVDFESGRKEGGKGCGVKME
jgi:hypothetical protein